MEQLKVSALKPGAPLGGPVFHHSGETLLDAGNVPTPDVIRMLDEAGIDQLFHPEPGEDPGEFIHRARNLVMSVSDLKVGQRMTQAVFDRAGTLLVEMGAVVTDRIANSLRRRGVHEIYVRKGTKELDLDQVQAFRRARRRKSAGRPAPIDEQIDASRKIKTEDCNPDTIDELLEAGQQLVSPSGDPFREELRKHDPLEARGQAAKDGFLAMYEQSAVDTAEMFQALQDKREVDAEKIGSLARGVVGGLSDDRDLLLNLSNIKTEYSYLLGHSLGVTMMSISLATQRGYDRRLVLEMAHAAYLHNIGMLRVPNEIVGKTGKLTEAETMQIHRHPIHSLDMLQRLVGRRSGLAGSIPIVAYQSHERENGSGYPKGRHGSVIHDFAKMISICDVYQALTSKRPWREPMLPYAAMEHVVMLASQKVFDPAVVRVLLGYMSLFPIGSWVELSDGTRGRVVAVTERDYTRPVVSVRLKGEESLEKPMRVNLADEKGVNIVRPIPCPEGVWNLMEGF